MSLGIYSSADPSTAFSSDGSYTKPLEIVADGAIGESIEYRLYIRSDSGSLIYSNIVLSVVDGGDQLIDGTRGYSWKLFEGDQKPTREQWDLVAPGSSISLSDNIEDTNTYLPIWVKVNIPKGAPISSYTSVQLSISADESIG